MKILEKNSDYHSNPAVGSTLLKKIHSKSLLHALSETREETDAMILGSAVHCAILEPERFSLEHIVSPKFDRRTKEGKEGAARFEAEAAGKVVLDPEQMKIIEGIKAAIAAHPIAADMLSGGEAEYSYYVEEPVTGMMLKCRPDYHNAGALIDVKTCQDASFEGFSKQAGQLGYHLQGAYYTDVFNKSQGTNYNEFFFIAVESKYPHAVAVYRMDALHMEQGRAAYKKSISKLALYREGGENQEELRAFHGYPAEIRDMQIPVWFLDRIGG